MILGAEREPFAVNGPVAEGVRGRRPTSCNTQAEALNKLSDQVDKFWKLESGGVFDQEKAMLASDKSVVQKWAEAVKHEGCRYTLPIPFRKNPPKFPDNKPMAEKRLASLRNRLQNNEALRAKYQEGIEDLVNKGHAVAVMSEDMEQSRWQSVVPPSSPGD